MYMWTKRGEEWVEKWRGETGDGVERGEGKNGEEGREGEEKERYF